MIIRPFLLQHREPIDNYVDKLGAVSSKAAEGLQQAVQDGFSLVNQAAGVVRRKRP